MTDIQTDSTPEHSVKYFSERSVAVASYIGGPLGAAVLVRRNFINSGQETHGTYALVIGIVSTILLLASLFVIPEQILSKIPNPLIPMFYTGIIYLAVVRLQGSTIKAHKENEGLFYSWWRAAGIGGVSALALLVPIIGYAYFGPDDFGNADYNNKMAVFYENEAEAFEFFDLLQSNDLDQAVVFMRRTGVPKWKQNLQILDEMDGIEGLSPELKKQNDILREYCQLRIESYQLIGKAIEEDTEKYDSRIDAIILRMDELLTPQ